MKRRNFLIALSFVPFLVTISCKKDLLPKTSTIVRGKVIDEKGNPIENISFKLEGFSFHGVSVAGGGVRNETFKIEKVSDKQGNFELSYIVPEITTEASFSMGSTFIYSNYKIQGKKNGIDINFEGSLYMIPPKNNDKTKSIIIGELNECEIILAK